MANERSPEDDERKSCPRSADCAKRPWGRAHEGVQRCDEPQQNERDGEADARDGRPRALGQPHEDRDCKNEVVRHEVGGGDDGNGQHKGPVCEADDSATSDSNDARYAECQAHRSRSPLHRATPDRRGDGSEPRGSAHRLPRLILLYGCGVGLGVRSSNHEWKTSGPTMNIETATKAIPKLKNADRARNLRWHSRRAGTRNTSCGLIHPRANTPPAPRSHPAFNRRIPRTMARRTSVVPCPPPTSSSTGYDAMISQMTDPQRSFRTEGARGCSNRSERNSAPTEMALHNAQLSQ